MAAKYASLIAGLGFAAMAFGMILSPITMGLIVTNHVRILALELMHK